MNKLLHQLNIILVIGIYIAVTPIVLSAQEVRDEVYYFQEGQAAMKAEQFDKAVQHFKKADSLRANHPTILEYLATACSRAEMKECTLESLKKLGLINADLSVLQDSVFHRWQRTPSFQEVVTFYEQMNEKVTTSDTAFVIPEKDLHPESIAYDPRTENFYISSIRKRKIIKRNPDGSFIPFSSDGLLAASGMKIDMVNNFLWVASPATSEITNFTESIRGKSFVFKLDLESGKIIKKYKVEDGNEHFFGDLVIGPTGKIFVTDSVYPAIYAIDQKDDSMQLLKYFEGLRSLQGITFVPGKEVLYFADYVKGIFRFDISSGKITEIDSLPEISLKGIDGLYYFNNSLIAIQNGVHPMRITKLYLNDSGTEIKNFEYLEKNNPLLDEPTLGTFVGNTFYYVANSPWNKYTREGEMLPVEKLDKGLILKIFLKN